MYGFVGVGGVIMVIVRVVVCPLWMLCLLLNLFCRVLRAHGLNSTANTTFTKDKLPLTTNLTTTTVDQTKTTIRTSP